MTIETIMKRGNANTEEDLQKTLAALSELRTKQSEALKEGAKKALASLRRRIRRREQEAAALRLFVGIPGNGYPDSVEVRG